MTKRWALPVGLGIVATLAGVGWLVHERGGASSPNGRVTEGGTVSVGVEALVESPDRYRGDLRVSGIVVQVAPEDHLFSMADMNDRDEVVSRGDTECVTLPVRWAGPMPARHDHVQVQGKVEASEGKLVFVASSVTKTSPSPPPGGAK